MSDFSQSLAISASGMEAQASRLRHISENIANADTPGYRRKLITFEATGPDDRLVAPGRVRLDQSDLPQIYDPNHPMADAGGYFAGSNVDLLIEIADAREAQRSYDANLRLFDQSRQMVHSLFEILRS